METIPTQYTWDLEAMFASQEEFDEQMKEAKKLLWELKAMEGHICDSIQSFCSYMDKDELLGCFLEDLVVYAKMSTDVTASDEAKQKNLAAAMTLMQQASIELNFASLELIHHKDTIQTYLAQDVCKDYRFPMYELFRTLPHRLSDEQEQLLSEVQELTSAAQETFQSFRVEFEPVIVDGKEEFLNGATYHEFLKNKNETVRKEAFEKYFKEYKRYENVFANLLVTHAKGQVFHARQRHYQSALEASLFQDEATAELFHNVLDMANKKYHSYLHEYYHMKKELLHLTEQHVYDIALEMSDDVQQTYTIEECFDILYQALQPLGDEYVSLLRKAKEERWIDFYPSKEKRTGAYSWGTYRSHPYILTNFTGSYESLSTLAHELGHSMHSYFSNRANRPMLAGYKIFVAEVASTVNEILLNRYLLDHTTDEKVKCSILADLMDQLIGTLYRQPMFAKFEEQLHTWVQNREPVSSFRLTNYYWKLNQEYFGDAVIVDELQKYGCYYIPHFYYNFYVYKYTLGMSVALSFANEILKGNTQPYLDFLHKGGSEPCIEELKQAGVDPCKEKVYEDAFTFFKETMDEFYDIYTSVHK